MSLSRNIIRGYELKERLGVGGFGAVYRAIQPSVGREVAIKVILPQYANQPEFIRRFEAEAHLVARLEHPHIVPLYDFWRDPEGAYLVMRFVRGGSLRNELNRKPLELNSAITILEEIASALDAAHRHHVVHCDIKPDNILLDEEGNAYLSDFGIAQILKPGASKERHLPEETLTGSLGYISPEQAKGEALTRRSDLYSLGVIAFEMLAGRHPFHQFSPSMQMVKHLTEALPPIVTFRADLPVSLDEVIHSATSKKPEERYDSAGEFVLALKVALSGSTFTTAAPSYVAVKPAEEAIVNPYKGLRAFEEADAEDFFGRDKLIHKLIERLETPTTLKTTIKRPEHVPYRFLAVVGPSGSGKSSVVKAGLIPALRRGFLPGSANWVITQMTPGDHPMEQLENELLSISARPITNLRERLWKHTDGLLEIVPELLPDLNTEVLIVVDQFEEVFTHCTNEKERVQFLESIRQAVIVPESRLRVIVTLRADFYDRPLMYAGFGELLQQRTEVVLPLSANELAQAIIAPAERVNVAVERGLAIDIAAEVTDQPGALPLLQYALTELFDRREGHIMTRNAYRSLGGVMGALTRRANDLYESLDPEGQQAVKILFQRLVTLGEGTEDTRRRVLQAELDSLSPQINRVIDIFGKARLLSYDRDPVTRTPTVELAHEALVREWDALREWLNENRESIRYQRHLTQAAQDWAAQGRDTGDLYRGARLVQMREWAETHKAEINVLEQEFLEASIAQADLEVAEHEAQQKRELEAAQRLAESEKTRAEEHAQAAQRLRVRGRFLAGALAAAVVLLLAAIWFGYQANVQRQQAEANFLQSERLRLAALASSNLLSGADIEAAPLLSLESLKLGYTQEADLTLQQAMTFIYPKHILKGHQGSVFAVAISPDSKIAATASTDMTIILWDIASGNKLRTLTGHTNSIASIAFSPNGRWLVSSGDDTTIRVWDVATGAEIRRLTGHQAEVWGVAFSPDGTKIASVGYDNTLRVWNAQNGTPLLTIELPTTATTLAYSPDGKYIATNDDDTAVHLYDANDGHLVREFRGHKKAVVSIAYSHDGLTIATGSYDKTARLWDANTGEELTTLVGHQEIVYSVGFSSDDRYVLTASYDRTAILWDRETGVRMQRFIGHEGSLYAAAISPDDQWVLTGSVDTTARLWPSGITPSPYAFHHTGSVNAIAISPDDSILGTATSNGSAFLWDTKTGEVLRQFSEHQEIVESIAISPDGRYVATSGDDYTVRLWLTSTGEQITLIEGFATSIWAVRFSPDGSSLVTVSNDGLDLWSARDGTLTRQYATGQEFYSAVFSPDGKYILAGGNDGISLYETDSGKLLTTVAKGGERGYNAVAISPDGRYAAAGGGNLLLMEFPSLNVIKSLEGHTGGVLSATFSPDGTLLLTSSEDGTARIWDIATGSTLRALSSLQALASSAVFSKDGKQIYIGGADNTVRMWDLDYRALVERACKTVTRDFTPQERQKYGINDQGPVCNP